MFDSPQSSKEPLRDVFLKGIVVHNPVLVQVIGICPVVAAAVSLRAAALLASIYTLVLILTEVIASAFLKKTVRWVRVAIYMLIGLAVISPFSYFLEKNDAGIRLTVGIYLSLLAANSLAVLRCEKIAVKQSVKYSFFDALAASIGYSTVFILVGFVRELFGSGAILDKPVRFIVKTPGMLMPFGGFLVLGFMAAALRSFIIRHYPQYAKAMMIRITPTPVTLKAPVEEDDETLDEPPTANMSAAAPDDRDLTDQAEQTDDQNEETPNVPDDDSPVEDEDSKQKLAMPEPVAAEPSPNTEQEPMPQETPEGVTGSLDPDGIDLKFQELLHFLEECDTVPTNEENTDG